MLSYKKRFNNVFEIQKFYLPAKVGGDKEGSETVSGIAP